MNVVEFLLWSIPLLIQFYADLYRKIDFENTMLELESEFNVPKIKTYDFIIVGGGSSGCVLAGRLSESFNVLLLEAGGTPPPATVVPFYNSAVREAPSINNFFKSVPQANASLNNNGVANSYTGHMLGGSSSHNGMLHNRGSPKDYDNWAILLNDNSFSYTNVLKYFTRMETFIGPKFGDAGDEYYGKDGPIQIHSTPHPVRDVWFDAARELGYPIQDPSAYQREGFSPVNHATGRGQRSTSYAEYIRPYESLRNSLTVIRYANVSEILLDDNKKAYGVAYMRHEFPQIAHAQKEIILSAGTYSSPLLLMKSGIGPQSILTAAEIPVKVPLEAVGKNFVDHARVGLSRSPVNFTSLMNSTDIETISENFHNGKGVLATTGSASVQCFIVSSKAEPDWPDLMLTMSARVSVDNVDQSVAPGILLGRPKSKGVLSLDTEKYKAGVRDDVQLALIDTKLLTHPDDIEVILEAVDSISYMYIGIPYLRRICSGEKKRIKFIFRIIETEAFKNINFTYTEGPDPACGPFTYLSDNYWRCKIQQDSMTPWHPVGTCSMGPDSTDSTTSVVDTKFRVKGVSNLRVVDASVIPKITNNNINAPVMMLAEKAAEDIINFYQVTETTSTLSPVTDPVSTSSDSTTQSGSTTILAETNKLFLVSIFAFVVKSLF